MNNNNVTIPKSTIFNFQSLELEPDDDTITDAESILKFLQHQPNISYFALYTNSVDTPLLTIPRAAAIFEKTAC